MEPQIELQKNKLYNWWDITKFNETQPDNKKLYCKAKLNRMGLKLKQDAKGIMLNVLSPYINDPISFLHY